MKLVHLNLALLVAAGIGGLGCSHRPACSTTLHVIVSAGPTSRDPLMTFDRASLLVFGNVMQTVMADPTGQWSSSGVVERWTNPDPSTWVLYLRKGLRFHDGKPLTAQDVAASILRVRSEERSPLHGFVQNVASVVVEDSDRLRLVINGPANVLWRLASIPVTPGGAPVPPDGLPVGSGPYRVTEWRGNRIRMERTASGTIPPSVPQRVDIAIIPNAEGQLRAARALRPVIVVGAHQELLDEAGRSGLSPMEVETKGALYLVCNVRSGRPLASLEARRALAAACYGKIPSPPGGHWHLADDIIPRRVFGHVDGRFAIDSKWAVPAAVPKSRLRLVAVGNLASLAKAVAECLERGGWRVELVSMSPREAFRALQAGQFDLSVVGYDCTSGSALELLTLAFSRNGGTVNLSGYRNPRLDALVEEASLSFDPAAQRELLVEGGDIVVKDLPWIPLYQVKLIYLTSREVHLTSEAALGIDFSRVRIGP